MQPTIQHNPLLVELKHCDLATSSTRFELYTFRITCGKALFHSFQAFERKSSTVTTWKRVEDRFQLGEVPTRYNHTTHEWDNIEVPQKVKNQVNMLTRGFLAGLVEQF